MTLQGLSHPIKGIKTVAYLKYIGALLRGLKGLLHILKGIY